MLKNRNSIRSTAKTDLPPKLGGLESMTVIPPSFSTSNTLLSPKDKKLENFIFLTYTLLYFVSISISSAIFALTLSSNLLIKLISTPISFAITNCDIRFLWYVVSITFWSRSMSSSLPEFLSIALVRTVTFLELYLFWK